MLRSDVTVALTVPRSRDLACGEQRIFRCSKRSSARSDSLKYSFRRVESSIETCGNQHGPLKGVLATDLVIGLLRGLHFRGYLVRAFRYCTLLQNIA
jgi:hypothetical protein